jgi:hypothetical protein
LQAIDLLIEVALLLEVGGRTGCGLVRLKRGSRVVSYLEEVAADGVKATIGVDPGIGPKTLGQFETGPGPGDHASVKALILTRTVVEFSRWPHGQWSPSVAGKSPIHTAA